MYIIFNILNFKIKLLYLILITNLVDQTEIFVSNVIILFLSSITIIGFHIELSIFQLIITFVLGLCFLFNQIDETYASVFSRSNSSHSLFIVIYTHLSHLSLCLWYDNLKYMYVIIYTTTIT